MEQFKGRKINLRISVNVIIFFTFSLLMRALYNSLIAILSVNYSYYFTFKFKDNIRAFALLICLKNKCEGFPRIPLNGLEAYSADLL